MIIELTLKSEDGGNIILPSNYHEILQAFIYNNIDAKLATFLHDKGYNYNSRNFKLFTFSAIISKGKLKNGFFTFDESIKFYISSPLEKFIQSFKETICNNEFIFLKDNKLCLESLKIISSEVLSNNILVDILSPVVAYSTIIKENNKKFTQYFEPDDEFFCKNVTENLIKKHNLLYGKIEDDFESLSFKKIKFGKMQAHKYKGFVIKGYVGKLEITGDKRLLQVALDSGLGSKNSQGFGFINLLKNL